MEHHIGRLRWPLLALLLAGLAAAVISLSTTQAAPPSQSGGPPAVSQAANATPNDVNRVAKQLYCPVCPNTPLNVCETQACRDWRELIRTKLAGGASDREIIDYFVAQYGERVLAAPPAQGFNLLVWIVPLLASIGGLAALAAVLRAWPARRRKPEAGGATNGQAPASPRPQVQELPAEYIARIEREVQSLRSH